VVADPRALYSGAALDGRGLNPGANPRLGATRFEDWALRAGLKGLSSRIGSSAVPLRADTD
jgi:hypothetical protein